MMIGPRPSSWECKIPQSHQREYKPSVVPKGILLGTRYGNKAASAVLESLDKQHRLVRLLLLVFKKPKCDFVKILRNIL